MAAFLPLAALVSACTPSLYRFGGAQHYRAKAVCSQGPLEFTVKAGGARWGERISLDAHGPRDLGGYYEVLVDGKLLRRGEWGREKEVFVARAPAASAPATGGVAGQGTGGSTASGAAAGRAAAPQRYFESRGTVAVTKVDNQRCLTRPAGGAGAAAGAGADGAGAAPTGDPSVGGGGPQGRPRATTSGAVGGGKTDARTVDPGVERTDWQRQRAKWPATVFRFPIVPEIGTRRNDSSCYGRLLAPRNAFPRNAKVVIRLWSTAPNDLEDVVFSVHHGVSAAAKSWEKRQRKRFRACLDRHPQEKRRWAAITREKKRQEELEAKRRALRPRSRCLSYLTVTLKDQAGQPYRVHVAKDCYCLRLPQDVTCWGEGGRPGFERRLAESPPPKGRCETWRKIELPGYRRTISLTRPCRCFQNLADEGCWGKGGFAAAERAEREKVLDGNCLVSEWVHPGQRAAARELAWRRAHGRWIWRHGKRVRVLARPRVKRPPPRPSGVPARYRYQVSRPCRCLLTPKDTACWGKGGREGFLDRLELALPAEGFCLLYHRTPHPRLKHSAWLLPIDKPCACFGRRQDEKCWGKGGYATFVQGMVDRFTRYDREAQARKARPASSAGGAGGAGAGQAERDRRDADAQRRYREVERQAQAARQRYEALHRQETAATPRRAAPVGADLKLPPKPPPARQERRPERPSKNALWVPGYWHRGAGRWHWIGGWWRVPPADVSKGLTARATRTPPAPKPELRRPLRPVPEAAWVPGYWHWHGGRYLWIPGRWRIPPDRRHRWRPAQWRRVPGGAIFLPGGWVLRVR